MSGDDVLAEPVERRIEVFTEAGRRRRYSPEIKARIVAESYARSVGEAADRYGLAKTQLFVWRREARLSREPAWSRVCAGGAGPLALPAPLPVRLLLVSNDSVQVTAPPVTASSAPET